jgi:hypothetical protein
LLFNIALSSLSLSPLLSLSPPSHSSHSSHSHSSFLALTHPMADILIYAKIPGQNGIFGSSDGFIYSYKGKISIAKSIFEDEMDHKGNGE